MQPQWIYDSVNFNKLLSVKEYGLGAVISILFRPYLLIYLLLLMKMMAKDTSLTGRKNYEDWLKQKKSKLLIRMRKMINMIS